jgi:hypothetical protein
LNGIQALRIRESTFLKKYLGPLYIQKVKVKVLFRKSTFPKK